MALSDAIDLIEICAVKSQNHIGSTLSFILESLEKGGKLLISEITRLSAVLTKLPLEQKAFVDQIGAKLVSAKMG